MDKVLCVVCGKANDEKNTRLRKSGFKCMTCVGKSHRPEVLAQLPEIKRSENKDTKRSGTLTVANCVTCNLKLQVPSGATLLTCPSCKMIMNPYNRDLRFLKCTSCSSFLQFSFMLACSNSSTSPFVACGRCDTPNLIPSSVLNPQILQTPAPIVVRFSNNGAVLITTEIQTKKERKSTPLSVLQSLPVHKYKRNVSKEKHSETTECSFCLCDFEEGEKIKTLPCFHMFHQKEVDKWLQGHTECPLCKTSVLL